MYRHSSHIISIHIISLLCCLSFKKKNPRQRPWYKEPISIPTLKQRLQAMLSVPLTTTSVQPRSPRRSSTSRTGSKFQKPTSWKPTYSKPELNNSSNLLGDLRTALYCAATWERSRAWNPSLALCHSEAETTWGQVQTIPDRQSHRCGLNKYRP